MDDLNILYDNDLQTIDLDLDTNTSSNNGLGIELLIDKNKIKNSPTNSPKKEDINLFNDDDMSNTLNSDKTIKVNNDNSNDNSTDNLKDNSTDNLKDNSYNKTNYNDIENDPIINKENKNNTYGEYKPIHMMSAQDIKNEKIDLIYKFKKLENQGIRTTMNYNMNSQLDDMRNEYIKLKKQRETENSIKFQRKMLMACITGIEFLNGKFDPFNVKLDGWSENINENINDYDEVFEELHDKYSGTGTMAPELRLLFMVGGSAFMFHLTNTMFKSSLPGMDDILKQNPELMQQFANAALNNNNNVKREQPQNMGPMGGLGGLMGGLMGNIMGNPQPQQTQKSNIQPQMDGAQNIDNILDNMNLDTDIDIDNISIISNESINNPDGSISLNI